MTLVPNWIDITNGAWGEEVSSGQMERICKDGNRLWGAIGNNNKNGNLYYSDDAGVTWENAALEIGNGYGDSFQSPVWNSSSKLLMIHQGYLHCFAITNSYRVYHSYKPTDLITAWTNWAHIFTTGNSLIAKPLLCAAGRSDGTLVIAVSGVASSGGFRDAVKTYKYSGIGGSWSSLTEIAITSTIVALQNGIANSSSGDLIFFVEKCPTPSGSGSTDLACYRLNASDDSIDGPFTVATAVEPGYITRNLGTPDLNGSSIMLGWIDNMQSAVNSYHDLKVSFADTSDLNTWTATTVSASADFTYGWSAGDGQTTFSSCVYLGSVPWVYYLTPYPAAFSPYPNWKMWRSSYVSGAWTTPEEWYDPGDADATLDPLRATHNGLDTLANFQLVKGFGTSGVGIAVDVEDWYIGYAGPPMGSNNYVSAGGPMATRGNFASA